MIIHLDKLSYISLTRWNLQHMLGMFGFRVGCLLLRVGGWFTMAGALPFLTVFIQNIPWKG